MNLIPLLTIDAGWLSQKNVSLNVLRLDEIHPVVSGNKWFKLKYYLQDAIATQKDAIATFGGAWSNHIVAAAYAGKEAGVKSIGIIRGEQPPVLSKTLQAAKEYGMELHFVSREAYRNKELIKSAFAGNLYWINEGGYGPPGAKGASEILQSVDTAAYTHIIAAVGTGTMLAGLLLATGFNQKVIGISSMKGNYLLNEQVLKLTGTKPASPFEIIHDYHFGGYGKHPQQLIDFVNHAFQHHHLPLDIVYTAKTFYAIQDLTAKDYFKAGSRLLMIHSGGLQGNSSLPQKVLAF